MDWQVNKDKAWFKKYWPSNCPKDVEFKEITCGEFFDRQRAIYPNEIFMWFLKSQMSYEEAGKKMDTLATALYHLGIRKGDIVALLMPNCFQFVISFYACLKIGVIVVPINPTLKQSEVLHQLRISDPTLVIAIDFLWKDVLRPIIHETNVEFMIHTNLIDLVENKKMVSKEYGKVPKGKIDFPNAIALTDLLKAEPYLPDVDIFPTKDTAVYAITGGTTGTPKICVLSHYNLVSNAIQNKAWFGGENRGIGNLGVLPLFHTYSMTSVMNTTIAMGGWMMLFPNPPPTIDLLSEVNEIYAPRGFIFVGAGIFFKRIIKSDILDEFTNVWQQFKLCVSSANPLHPSIQEEFQRLMGGRIVESYGLTEASPVVSAGNLFDDSPPNCIGLPLPGTDWIIFDAEDFQNGPIADGLEGSRYGKENVGELCICGPQVMLGYLKDPEGTREVLKKYVGRIWLLTGDLAYMNEDGTVALVGRKKRTLVTDQEPTYLVDAETILLKNKNVSEVAIFGLPPKGQDRGFITKLWVTLKSDQVGKVSREKLEMWTRRNIPRYRLATDIELVGEVPKAILGKIQKKALLTGNR